MLLICTKIVPLNSMGSCVFIISSIAVRAVIAAQVSAVEPQPH
ncbi:MAG: hypothetical protein ACFFG0_16040 [Candidatus Thorarchaeota archaeon]